VLIPSPFYSQVDISKHCVQHNTNATHVFEVVVPDVTSSEAERRSARVDITKVVVSVGHSDLGVLSSVRVRVTNERSLPVVVELAVGDGNAGTSMGNIEESSEHND